MTSWRPARATKQRPVDASRPPTDAEPREATVFGGRAPLPSPDDDGNQRVRLWLTSYERIFLEHAREAPGASGPEIARKAGIAKGTADKVGHRLEVARFIARDVDGRIRLTERGAVALDEARWDREADIWDLATIPTLAIPDHVRRKGSTRLNFRQAPIPFRSALREYLQSRLENGASIATLHELLRSIAPFLRFYAEHFPADPDFGHLSVELVDRYLQREVARYARATDGSAALAPHLLRGRISVVGGRLRLRGQPPPERAEAPTLCAPERQLAEETVRDVWRLDHLPGANLKDHWTSRTIRFDRIPAAFRADVKRYTLMKLTVEGAAVGWVLSELRRLAEFLTVFTRQHPAATDLAQLTREDAEQLLRHLRATPNSRGGQRPERDILDGILAPMRFARYLQRMEAPSAPARPIDRIFVPEHLPRAPHRLVGRLRYLPESVLAQLDQNSDALPARYLPVVIILRASGWRISDVLCLRYDRCLEREGQTWWLVGDIQKTAILGHRVPITAEVADVIRVQAAIARTLPEQDNPKRYLFPSTYHTRWGKPISANAVADALTALVKERHVVGPDGKPFAIRAHAFRHTKAVELINNGMSPLMVQHWLAHLTYEMTEVYAQIKEETLVREWKQATANGVLRLTDDGPAILAAEEVIGTNELELAYVRSNLDATRTDKGYCFKPKKMACPYVEIACYSCRNWATTPDFLPEFETMERDLRFQIELGQRAGREHWVDKNQRKLAQILPVIATLRAGQAHTQMTKAEREETAAERPDGVDRHAP